MFLTLLSLTLQSGGQSTQQAYTQTQIQTQTQAETKTATQTPAKTEKYVGGYYLFIVKGNEKWSFELQRIRQLIRKLSKRKFLL